MIVGISVDVKLDVPHQLDVDARGRVRQIADVVVGDVKWTWIDTKDGNAYDWDVSGPLKGTRRSRTPTFPEHYLATALDLAKSWKGAPTNEQAISVAHLLQRWAQADDLGRLPKPPPEETA